MVPSQFFSWSTETSRVTVPPFSGRTSPFMCRESACLVASTAFAAMSSALCPSNGSLPPPESPQLGQ
ncbi:hypothetical protein R2F25_33910 [Streptomyces sp. UP1A-1]|nr:hypothetical protein [Streptomyces sp. UP1A-1]